MATADDVPTVTHEGVVKLGDLEITVMRLSNGENVIEAESFRQLMEALFGDDAINVIAEESA
jgi:hypothetical protein